MLRRSAEPAGDHVEVKPGAQEHATAGCQQKHIDARERQRGGPRPAFRDEVEFDTPAAAQS